MDLMAAVTLFGEFIMTDCFMLNYQRISQSVYNQDTTDTY